MPFFFSLERLCPHPDNLRLRRWCTPSPPEWISKRSEDLIPKGEFNPGPFVAVRCSSALSPDSVLVARKPVSQCEEINSPVCTIVIAAIKRSKEQRNVALIRKRFEKQGFNEQDFVLSPCYQANLSHPLMLNRSRDGKSQIPGIQTPVRSEKVIKEDALIDGTVLPCQQLGQKVRHEGFGDEEHMLHKMFFESIG